MHCRSAVRCQLTARSSTQPPAEAKRLEEERLAREEAERKAKEEADRLRAEQLKRLSEEHTADQEWAAARQQRLSRELQALHEQDDVCAGGVAFPRVGGALRHRCPVVWLVGLVSRSGNGSSSAAGAPTPPLKAN